jgi:hypothetical protein
MSGSRQLFRGFVLIAQYGVVLSRAWPKHETDGEGKKAQNERCTNRHGHGHAQEREEENDRHKRNKQEKRQHEHKLQPAFRV